MNFWVHVLKMLWKFVKVQMITALTLTTSFQAGHWYMTSTKEFTATDTMRNDRKMNFPLADVKKWRKNERESFYFKSDDNFEIARWNDNSVVTMKRNAWCAGNRKCKEMVKGTCKQILSNPPLLLHITVEWTALSYLTVRYPIWGQWFVEEMVLTSGHCNQYYICIQLGGCIVPFLVKLYHRKFSNSTLWVEPSAQS